MTKRNLSSRSNLLQQEPAANGKTTSMFKKTLVLSLFVVILLFGTHCTIVPPAATLAPTSVKPTVTSASGATPSLGSTPESNATPKPDATKQGQKAGLPAVPNPPTVTPPLPFQAKLGTIDRDVTYCTVDKIALKMDVYYPKKWDGGAIPALLNLHGGSWSAGDKEKSETTTDIPELTSRGYLVFGVNYRLAPTWKFPTQLEDIKCVVRYLRASAQLYHLDPKHLGAWGCSAGGHLAAMLALTDSRDKFEGRGGYLDESSRIQAVVTLSAPTDLSLYDPVARSDMLLRVFGTDRPLSPTLIHASPVNYASKDDPPFLIIQGDKDNIVALKHGQELEQRLTAVGSPAQLVTVKDGRHCLPPSATMSPSRAAITQEIADFFDKTLRK